MAVAMKERKRKLVVVEPQAQITPDFICEHALLVKLKISAWSGRKLDKEASDEIAEIHGSDKDRGKFIKSLLPKEKLDKIQKLDTKLRQASYKRTLPWSDDNERMIANTEYDNYVTALTPLICEREHLVRDLGKEYLVLVEAQKQYHVGLGSLWKASDYPTLEELLSSFSVEIIPKPLTASGDFRCTMSAQHLKKYEHYVLDNLNEALKTPWKRALKVVSNVSTKVKAYNPDADKFEKNAFRDSLIGNVIDLLKYLPALNITNNQDLNDVIRRMHDEIAIHSAESLRENAEVREKVAMSADDIMKKMSTYI